MVSEDRYAGPERPARATAFTRKQEQARGRPRERSLAAQARISRIQRSGTQPRSGRAGRGVPSFSWPCGQQSRPKKRYYADARPSRRGNALLRQTGSTAGPVLLGTRRSGRSAPLVQALDSSEMLGGRRSSAELTISVKLPCQECGGRGFVETVTDAGHVVGDTTKECLACGGKGLIPDDMPLSQFREVLKATAPRRFARRT